MLIAARFAADTLTIIASMLRLPPLFFCSMPSALLMLPLIRLRQLLLPLSYFHCYADVAALRCYCLR